MLVCSLLVVTLVSGVGAQSVGGNSNRQLQTGSARSIRARSTEVIGRVFDKVESRYARYDEFVSKLETRRAKLAEQGYDVTELDNSIRLLKVELSKTNAVINNSRERLSQLDFSQGVNPVRQSINTEVKEIRAAFKLLHQTAVNCVQTAQKVLASKG